MEQLRIKIRWAGGKKIRKIGLNITQDLPCVLLRLGNKFQDNTADFLARFFVFPLQEALIIKLK